MSLLGGRFLACRRLRLKICCSRPITLESFFDYWLAMRFIVFLYALLFCIPAWGFRYMTMLENSGWQNQGSPFDCRLSHPVTGFGDGRFSHVAGGERQFILTPRGLAFDEARVDVSAVPPVWLPGRPSRDLAGLMAVSSPLTLGPDLATVLLVELLAGMQVSFQGIVKETRAEPFEVLLSPASFSREYEQFLVCESKLLSAGFHDVERTRIQYASSEIDIPRPGRRVLEQIAEYVLADPKIKSLYVDGHTDDTGSPADNVRRSEQRARQVTDYLVGLGVAAKKIVTRYHGQQYPVVKNSSASNRSKNRRTTIRLSRAAPIRPVIPAPVENEAPDAAAEDAADTQASTTTQTPVSK
jgi:outer membrane protein OmpA-like peptidoglycan-associated protein